MARIRVAIPYHLRVLAGVSSSEVELDLAGPATVGGVIDALELKYPKLRGTVRDHYTGERRPLLRFFACGEDLSLEPLTAPLPADIVTGKEPFIILGAIAGG